LIGSIGVQPNPKGYQVEIVVVDNNDGAIAADALHGLSNRFPITVVHEAQIGLVHARNRVLGEASAREADWLIGVDDDVWVDLDWLANFITGFEAVTRHHEAKQIADNDALIHPIFLGPCRYVYGEDLSSFLQPYQVPALPHRARPQVMSTANYAMHRCVFDARYGPGLRFEPAFNESGGEDLEFFLRAERVYGWVPAWLPNAVVSENWADDRATLHYNLARVLRNQVSAYQVAQRHRQLGIHGSRIQNFARILLRLNRQVIFGTGGLIAGLAMFPFRPKKGRALIGYALTQAARAFAVVPYVLGQTPVAYGLNITPPAHA
jgi:glycosyltransferase involved in cell wall biosynthesis